MRSLLLLIALLGCKAPAAAPAAHVVVSLVLAGATAEVIEHDVVEPVEAMLATVAGVKAMESRIEAGHATVVLELAPAARIETVTHEVRQAVSDGAPTLPAELSPPEVSVERRDSPILWIAITDQLPVTELSTLARTTIKPRIERLAGVAGVELRGFAELAVIVRPDLDKLTALGLTLFDLVAALQGMEVGTAETAGEIVLRDVNGATIRVRDVAVVEASFERDATSSPEITVRAQAATTASEVRATVRHELAAIEKAAHIDLIALDRPISARPPATLVVTLRGPGLDELRDLARSIHDELARAGIEVVRDPVEGTDETAVLPDRERAAELGVSIVDVVATLSAVGGNRIGTITVEGEPRDVMIRLPTTSLPATIQRLRVPSKRVGQVALSDVVTLTTSRAEPILRRDREHVITLSIFAQGPALATARAIAKKRSLAGSHVELAP